MSNKALPINEYVSGDFTYELTKEDNKAAQVRGLNVLLTNMAGTVSVNYKGVDVNGDPIWLLLEAYTIDTKDTLGGLDGLELQIVGVGATGASMAFNDLTAVRNR